MGNSLSQTIHEGLGPGTILDSLACEVRAERAIAADHLKRHLAESEYQQALIAYLGREVQPSPVLLDALSLVAEVGELPIFERLVHFLKSDAAAIRKHAARVIARCFSRRCRELGPWFADGDIRYECCFSHDEPTAEALLEWYRDASRTPDIAYGLMLTPEILCWLSQRHPTFATSLASQFGYLEDLEFATAAPLLECGLWCVPNGISLEDQERLAHRSAEIEEALISLLQGTSVSHDVALNLGSVIDVAAFCGAVRALDHQSLMTHRFENRLHSRALENIRRALCKHAPFSFCRKILISDALHEADQLGVMQRHQGQYVLERAAAMVTHDSDLRTERVMYLKSRWAGRSNSLTVVPSNWTFPVLQDADAPELKYRILTVQQWGRAKTFLDAPSPGALAAARLLQVTGRDDLIEPLFTFERACEPLFRACGSELQLMISSSREHESLAWKQTLRALGIPSPRRPEYRSMVEVSVPPSRSYAPQVLLPLLLEQLGLFVEPADIALHLSFSGDLHDDIRYLLFAQQFINLPRIRPGALRLARLMSKGFAHLNEDAIPLDGVNHGGQRTELRSYRFGYHGSDDPQPLQRHFIDDIIETSALIAANTSPSPALAQVWTDYCEAITAEAARHPACLKDLLHADWYAATGEPRDEDFARRLPIVQAWTAVSHLKKAAANDADLRQTFREIRRSAASSAVRLLNVESLLDGVGIVTSASGAPYFDPAIRQ